MSQHYPNPDQGFYHWINFDFGGAAGNTTHRIAGPAGKKGKLREVGVALSEATVFATTLGQIQVGLSTDLDAYGLLNIATGTAANTVFNSKDDTDAIIKDTTSTAVPQPTKDIPADSCVLVTLVEGTGAGLAGKGDPYVIIDWF